MEDLVLPYDFAYMRELKSNILVFFIIFGFPIISRLNSVKVVVVYTLLALLLGGRAKYAVKDLTRNSMAIFLFLYAILGFVTLIITFAFGAFDYSLYFRIVSSEILIICCFFFYRQIEKDTNIPFAIYSSFVVQSIFIFLCIFSESFYNFTVPFRESIAEHHMAAYGRLRGTAIAGYQFFGISTMYGFVIIWAFLYLEKNIKSLLSLLFVIIAGIISGRYCSVAVILGLLFYILKLFIEKKYRLVFRIMMISLILVCSFVFACYKISDSITNPVTKRLYDNYIMEPLKSIVEEKSFHSSSTDVLKEMYKLNIDDYLLLGSGRFINDDGSYFGHIDIGWYRVILYYGVGGLIVLGLLFCMLLFISKKKKINLLKISFFLYFIALNFKGDIQLYSNNIIPLLIGFIFFTNNSCCKNGISHNYCENHKAAAINSQ